MTKDNSVKGIDFAEVNKYSKVLKIAAKGKSKVKFVNDVLDAILGDYEKAKEGTDKDAFEEYKGENSDMLQFYMDNKDFSGEEEPPAEVTEDVEAQKLAEEPEKEPEVESEEVEEEVVVEEPEKEPDKPLKPTKAKAGEKKEGKKKKGEKSKKTRAEVFGEIMAPGKKLSKKEIVEEMVDRYKGSPAEAEFQIATFLRLLVSLDFAEKDIKGKYSLLR